MPSTMNADESAHSDAIADLTAIARAVAVDPSLVVVQAAPGQATSIDTREKVIWIDLQADWPKEIGRALAIHEAGHLVVSHYPLFVAADPGLQGLASDEQQALAYLLNCLEDIRMERWLSRRLPGCGPWLEATNRLFSEQSEGRPLGLFMTYLASLLVRHSPGCAIPGLDSHVAGTLEATEPAVLAYLACQPPTIAAAYPEARALYAASPAARCFVGDPTDVDGFAATCRLSAWGAFEIAVRDIWPEARRLLVDDVAAGRSLPAPPRPRSGLAAAEAPSGTGIAAPGEGPSGASTRLAAGHAADIAERVRTRLIVRSPESLSSVAPYAEIRSEVAAPSRRLATLLEALFEPLGRPRLVGGFADGCRIDLRGAMAYEADRRKHMEIWMRRVKPTRRQEHVQVLCDLSGSMSGAKEQALLRAVVMLAEALQECRLPFAINGFQDRLIPFKEFHEPLSEIVRESLSQMTLEVHGSRPGGHNNPGDNDDGFCVRQAGEELLCALAAADAPVQAGILVVLSDGYPAVSGRPSDRCAADLRSAVDWAGREGLHLVGLGVGRDTQHVEDFYPISRASVPVADLPEVLGGLVRTALGSVHARLLESR